MAFAATDRSYGSVHRTRVGAGSAREAGGALCQVNRGMAFAATDRSCGSVRRTLVGAGSAREGRAAVYLTEPDGERLSIPICRIRDNPRRMAVWRCNKLSHGDNAARAPVLTIPYRSPILR
jgi:hypothetical protein